MIFTKIRIIVIVKICSYQVLFPVNNSSIKHNWNRVFLFFCQIIGSIQTIKSTISFKRRQSEVQMLKHVSVQNKLLSYLPSIITR